VKRRRKPLPYFREEERKEKTMAKKKKNKIQKERR
jgi:hypothetical protein